MGKKAKYRPRRDFRHFMTVRAGAFYEPHLRRKPGVYRPRMIIWEAWRWKGKTIKFAA